MNKIILIGTVASSFYGFRADLIRTLLKKGHQVYAFTSEYTAEDLKKIEKLGATPITYTLNRGGLNPLADIIATYQLSKKISRPVRRALSFAECAIKPSRQTKNPPIMMGSNLKWRARQDSNLRPPDS